MSTIKQALLQNAMALALIVLGGTAYLVHMPDIYVSGLVMSGLTLAKGVHLS